MAGGAHFDAALEQELSPTLSDVDRRLAHEIAAGVLRTRAELDRHLAPQVKRAWRNVQPDLQDLLRIGAYQLLKLERVPAHAAVQTSVELAKQEEGVRAGHFVNAVLRAVTRATPTEGTPPRASDEIEALARRESHPPWLVRRWAGRFGLERTAAILMHNNRQGTIVLQPVRWSAERLGAALAAAGVSATERDDGWGIEVSGMRVSQLPGYDDGAFVVQDPTHARLVAQASIPNGSTVWDTCAAPGGKAAILGQRCRVLASDASRPRLARLRATLSRAAPRVPVFAADARRPPFPPGVVDVVVVDAPCSATGTIARHPDARWRITRQRIERLAQLQGAILDGAATTVGPGGLLVYMTCSLEPEENERQVDAFLDRAPDFRRRQNDLMLVPGEDASDGGFGAVLQRSP